MYEIWRVSDSRLFQLLRHSMYTQSLIAIGQSKMNVLSVEL